MSERKKSVESFDEFFGAPKNDKNNDDNDDDDKKSKHSDIPPSSGVAALIRAQPIIHHRQTPSESIPNTNSTTEEPLTTHVKNASPSLTTKSKSIHSPQSKAYESDLDNEKNDVDDDTSVDGNKKHSSLSPPPKQRSPETPAHSSFKDFDNEKTDVDDDTTVDGNKKHSSLPPPPPPKKPSPEVPRRRSDPKLKVSHTIPNQNIRRKERFLPSIRPKIRQKMIKKRQPKEIKNDIEQRVLSAQNDKLNQLRSYLSELRRQLEEERIENKTLRLVQKREEKFLKKYEDQEYDVHKMARDYTYEIEHVKATIANERETKIKLEKEIEDRDEILRNQRKRMRFYDKLVHENLDESDELRERLKETDKKLKKFQEKITNQDKLIENLEKNYRHEIHQELVKQRDIKRDIENQSKKYTDLLFKFENKTRQVDTMHIYIQRGGRRPSISSTNLAKSRSLQSLQDTSPRFREKMIEYDKKRREQEKFKPKPKLPLLPINPPPPPKRERKKYIPNIEIKPQIKKPPFVLPHAIHDEKPPKTIQNENIPPKEKPPPVRRLSIPHSTDEDKSEIEDDPIITSIYQKPISAALTKTIQRSEQHLTEAPIRKRSLTPSSPPFQPKFNLFETNGHKTTSNLFKHTESPSPPILKPHTTYEPDEKWPDTFDINKKEKSTKEDLLSKLIYDDQQNSHITTTTTTTTQQSSPPSSQRPSLIMFESSSISTNGVQKKPPTRITTPNVYDFDQATVNLHNGKPVTTPTTTTAKTSIDPFESLFSNNNNNKPTNPINARDDTFTTTQDKSDPLESLFDQSSSTFITATAIKPNSRQYPSPSDKLQRPKVVTNVPNSIPNRTVVEEIEEFVL